MVDFIVFIILFLGGVFLTGFAHGLPAAQGVVFTAGILLVSLSLAWVMRQAGSATRRSDSWSRRQQ
ncbi:MULTISPECIES: hypothetical protein [Microbacterium]|uniref:hypothetical protein n=1 Tax=Microbacterium TaxID=33882 RepID=UPI00217D1C66|nr:MULTISPECIES: hypothetical protein [Microbacterium]